MPEDDLFTATSLAIERFLDELGMEHPRAVEVLTLQGRWGENVSRTQIEGDTEQRRADRAQICQALNALALETIGQPFLVAGTLAPVLSLPLDTIPDLAPLPPGSRMPLARNPLFVGRETDLMHLAAALKAGGTAAIGQIAAATGLGGIGKTNLATEFVHRYGQYFAGGVFWLSFADAAGVPAEIAACGVGLDLPGFADLKLDDQVARVRHLWQEPIPRLLIFDNCEDEALLDQWRPSSGGCWVLLTSRRARWSSVLNVQALALGVLSRTESITLLRKHRPDLAEGDSDLDAIAAELGDLPLALHLAGSYLETYRDDPSLGSPAAVLAELRDARLLEHAALQGEDVIPSPTNHVLHVGRTFALSYERLRPDDAVDALAIALLARAACFAPGEPIPRALLLATIEAPDTTAQRRASKAVRGLVELGLLSAGPSDALTLHRLLAVFVSTTVQDREAQVSVERVLIQEASRLNTIGDPRPLLPIQPHLRMVTDASFNRDDLFATTLCEELGAHLRMIGDLAGARHYYERAVAILENVTSDHPNVAYTLDAFGSLLREQGEYDKARIPVERALVLRERTLGPFHPDTAKSLNTLGYLLRLQGDLSGGRVHLEAALAIQEQMLEPSHVDTASTLNTLGSLLREQGEYDKAQMYLERGLAIRKERLGVNHPDTAMSLNNLGALLWARGDQVGARSYHEQALVIRQRVLGEAHPNTAQSLNNLGLLLKEMNDLAGARPYYEQALAINKRVLGEQHPSTATSLNNLGGLLQAQGDLAGARRSYEQALAIQQAVLGKEHSDTATSLNNLGMLFQEMGDLIGARSYLEQALVIFEHVLGPDHPKTQIVRRNLTSLDDPPQTPE